MVARTTQASEARRQPAAEEQLRPVREAVAVLDRLLKTLFPDPLSLDVITVENIIRRYPLTGLGAPALSAIEQSQRIVRARGDYTQTGLCEFHIGLIYLHWDDCRAAANQFAIARQPWSLIADNAAMCLAYYAQGLGLYHAYHNEAAMLHFGRAERMLNRPSIGAQAERFAALAEEMRPLLAIAQETLRESLWPKEQAAADVLQAGYLSVPPDATTRATAAAVETAAPPQETPPEPPPAGEIQPVVEPPSERPEWARRVPLPISNLPGGLGDMLPGPVPGHITTDDRFGWYRIAEKRSDFLPDVSSGSWLLADRDVDERLSSGREYVVVGSARDDLGSIPVQPVSHSSAMPHCFLGYRIADAAEPEMARVYLNESNEPLPVSEMLVLAVVEGFWYGLNGHALPEAGR